MKTRRQYLAYVCKEQAANVSPMFIMNEWEFRGHLTPEEQIAKWEKELAELNDRMLPLIIAGEDHRDPMSNLCHMTGNARRIDNQIRAMESRFSINA
jgi:L-serine deaminase